LGECYPAGKADVQIRNCYVEAGNMLIRLCLGFLLITGAVPGLAQTTVTIKSGESNIVFTVWAAPSEPTGTVLLVPGWGGGLTDVLGIGQALSPSGISVVVLTPRGWHESQGTATFANSLDDIGAALKWIRSSSRSDLNASNIVLGGHSWGGGMSLAYAARDSAVRCVFSVAGTDHGQFIREYQSDPDFAIRLRQVLVSSAAPKGPIRFDVDGTLRELAEGQGTYGLLENVDRLADRRILFVGGWEDENVTVDRTLLPLYRALRKAGAQDVTFDVYHADHSFKAVRSRLHADLLDWVRH
jgi:pimeloyl-ACP methyl ester carboxylesterase